MGINARKLILIKYLIFLNLLLYLRNDSFHLYIVTFMK